jgi:hypothetical protein
MTEQQPPAGEPQPLPPNPFESINFVNEIFNLWFDLKLMSVLFDELVKQGMAMDGSALATKFNQQKILAAKKVSLDLVQQKFPQIPLQFTEQAKETESAATQTTPPIEGENVG